MIENLIKIATELDKVGKHSMADQIDDMVKSLAARTGLNLDNLISLADNLDASGEYQVANRIDEIIKSAKKKIKRPEPPKKWLNKMIAEVKKKEPSYSKKQALLTIINLWFDKLSDKAVNKILKKYKK